jgi:hypothetical protein
MRLVEKCSSNSSSNSNSRRQYDAMTRVRTAISLEAKRYDFLVFFFLHYCTLPRTTTQATMSELENLNNEISENESSGYSEFCDNDAILAVDEDVIDAVKDHFTVAGTEASSDATSHSIPGKRKHPDFLLFDRDGPSAAYRRRTDPSPIDFESPTSPSSSESRAGGPPPFIIVRFDKNFWAYSQSSIIDCGQAHNGAVKQAMDARALPWGVQWEIARLISLGYCSWDDITMVALDLLQTKGLPPSDPSHPDSTKPTMPLCAPVAPHVEDYFRWGRNLFGTQNMSREMTATVR